MKIILILLLWGIVFGLWAQSATDRWVDQNCNCFGSRSLAEMPKKALEQHADSCAKEALLCHYTPLLKEYKVDIDNDSMVLKMGERLGQLLYERCAGYRDYFYQIARAQLEEQVDKLPIATGYLVALHQDVEGHLFFWLWEATDSISTFLWEREFDGSARFFGGLGEYQWQKAEIAWEHIEYYDPLRHRYTVFKEVRWLNVLDVEPPLKLDLKAQKILAGKLQLKQKDFVRLYKQRQNNQ